MDLIVQSLRDLGRRPFRVIDWIEELVKAIFASAVGLVCTFLVNRLKKPGGIQVLRHWALNGLGLTYMVWVVTGFLYWVGLTLNSTSTLLTPIGFVNYATSCFSGLLAIGIPGYVLNRLAIRWSPKHWVARMTNSSRKAVRRSSTSQPSGNSHTRPSYIQMLSHGILRGAAEKKL